MKSKKISWFLFFLFAFATLGYAREFFFVFLNMIMYMKYYHSTSPIPVPQIMHVFEGFEYNTLYYSKYFYTILWVLIFYAFNYFALKKLTSGKFFLKILFYTYALMLCLAALSMAYGYLFHNRLQDDEYTLSRWLMGIAQSPIICLILLASEKLYLSTAKGGNRDGAKSQD